MAKIVMYSTMNCPYCRMAKEFFTSRNLPFEEIRVDLNDEEREKMMRLSNRRTVPQIFINDQSIGGYDDLMALVKSGEFNQLLNQQ